MLILVLLSLFTAGVGIGFGINHFAGEKTDKLKNKYISLDSTVSLNQLSSPKYGSIEDLNIAIKELKKILGDENVTQAIDSIDQHKDHYANCVHPAPNEIPQVVVFPGSTTDVSNVMKIAHKYRIPVIPYSGGTALEGHANATRGGIVVDIQRMNKVLAFHEKDLDIVVQPGVGWQELAEYLDPHKLLFGPDPGPGAEIGGMVATSCSGTNAARYGTMKENVIGLTVVLPDGTIVKTKRRPKKSAAGYNLTGLFIGSEGTLGIITETTLKVSVKPEIEIVTLINFKTIEAAAKMASDVIRKGIQLNALEIIDEDVLFTINQAGISTKIYREEPTMLFKIGGSSQKAINSLIDSVREISDKNDSTNFEFAKGEIEKSELWQARKLMLFSTLDYGRKFNKDANVMPTDVAVPISEMPKIIKEAKKICSDVGLKSRIVGHVGDGNFHCTILYNPDQFEVAKDIASKLSKMAIDLDGTCTGEHGIGMGKRKYLEYELGPEAVNLMRKIKQAVDPLNIMNPDKVFKMDPNEPNQEYRR